MAIIARSGVFKAGEGDDYGDYEISRAKERPSVCGWLLRKHYDIPEGAASILFVVHDRPARDRCEVQANVRGGSWLVDTTVDGQRESLLQSLDEYIIRKLKLKPGEKKTIYVACEYE